MNSLSERPAMIIILRPEISRSIDTCLALSLDILSSLYGQQATELAAAFATLETAEAGTNTTADGLTGTQQQITLAVSCMLLDAKPGFKGRIGQARTSPSPPPRKRIESTDIGSTGRCKMQWPKRMWALPGSPRDSGVGTPTSCVRSSNSPFLAVSHLKPSTRAFSHVVVESHRQLLSDLVRLLVLHSLQIEPGKADHSGYHVGADGPDGHHCVHVEEPVSNLSQCHLWLVTRATLAI
ncbi:hypothetical protein E4U34_004571 [Claviceps purpurea]|nr:hypothetical protein E4U34_004571 [Claviceps purpurea]